MKKRSLLFLSIFLLSINLMFSQFRVVGYLPTWMSYPGSINNVDLSKVTHVNIAFANPNSSGTLIPADGTNSDVATVVTAAHAKNVKVLISIGGSGAPGATYKNLITNSQASFVTSIVNYAVNNNLDGIDVDIEGDILDGTTLTATQYQNFVTALGTALHAQNKIMSAALATWFASYVTNTAAGKFDFVSIMSYDAAIPGSGDPVGQHSPYSLAVSDFQYWNGTKAVPAAKINIGVPFYGYGWGTYATPNNDEIGYCTIVTTYPGAENNDQVGSGNNVIYYNGIPTIKQKTTYALQNAGGIMIWELAEDCTDSTSLLTAINQIISTTTSVQKTQANEVKLDIYPNPVTDLITMHLEFPENGMISLSLYDITGRVIYKIEKAVDEQPSYQLSIPVSNLNSGIYFLKLETASSVLIRKIMK
ncbi:MAG: glycosyl hydrolase family 18 protein [Bacteroidia bacterium]